MINKKVFQVALLILLFLISIIFYQIYFSDDKSIVQKKNTTTVEGAQNLSDNSEEKTSNIIENLKYVSKDLLGNTYIITAESAIIKKDKENEVKLSEVNAKIIKKNNTTIFIYSLTADYNKDNHNTVFREKVNIEYEKQKIDANIVILNFTNNFIEILENVNYINEDTKIYADKAELNLLNR
jgi:Organic solvent tolerance protein OstA